MSVKKIVEENFKKITGQTIEEFSEKVGYGYEDLLESCVRAYTSNEESKAEPLLEVIKSEPPVTLTVPEASLLETLVTVKDYTSLEDAIRVLELVAKENREKMAKTGSAMPSMAELISYAQKDVSAVETEMMKILPVTEERECECGLPVSDCPEQDCCGNSKCECECCKECDSSDCEECDDCGSQRCCNSCDVCEGHACDCDCCETCEETECVCCDACGEKNCGTCEDCDSSNCECTQCSQCDSHDCEECDDCGEQACICDRCKECEEHGCEVCEHCGKQDCLECSCCIECGNSECGHCDTCSEYNCICPCEKNLTVDPCGPQGAKVVQVIASNPNCEHCMGLELAGPQTSKHQYMVIHKTDVANSFLASCNQCHAYWIQDRSGWSRAAFFKVGEASAEKPQSLPASILAALPTAGGKGAVGSAALIGIGAVLGVGAWVGGPLIRKALPYFRPFLPTQAREIIDSPYGQVVINVLGKEVNIPGMEVEQPIAEVVDDEAEGSAPGNEKTAKPSPVTQGKKATVNVG